MTAPSDQPATRRSVRFLGLDFAHTNIEEALAYCGSIDRQDAFRYISTPNVDHVVALYPAIASDVSAQFAASQRSAALCLCDSKILALLASLSGLKLSVLTGSDLTKGLFGHVFGAAHRIAVVGGTAELLERLHQAYPSPELLQLIPPMGVLDDLTAQAAIIDFVNAAKADYTLFTIGAPQSEIVAMRILSENQAVGLGLCVGASLEFLVGDVRRAPRLVQYLHLEWAFRLLSEPRRLWRRYLIRGPRIFKIWRDWARAGN